MFRYALTIPKQGPSFWASPRGGGGTVTPLPTGAMRSCTHSGPNHRESASQTLPGLQAPAPFQGLPLHTHTGQLTVPRPWQPPLQADLYHTHYADFTAREVRGCIIVRFIDDY